MAVVQVLQLWSNESYQRFLRSAKLTTITAEWFEQFAGEWKVARTIKDGKMELVRGYLDQDFRAEVRQGAGAEVVDRAAAYIQQQGWSSQLRKDGRGSRPISLVSKIAFFLSPTRLVPLDTYGKRGLMLMRAAGGSRVTKPESYHEFIEAFNEQFDRLNPQLAAALSESWVHDLARKIRCPEGALSSVAMRRKLLDNYFMQSAGFPR